MKIVCLSDVHLTWDKFKCRTDDVRMTGLSKLEYVLDWCVANRAILIQAGDFFDRARLWHLLPMVASLLWRYGVQIYTVFGQHDTYMYSDKSKPATNLGILASSNLVKICQPDQPIEHNEHLTIYGCSEGQEPIKPKTKRKTTNLLVIHKAIVSKKVWRTQKQYTLADKFIRENKGYNIILCGDIHQKFITEDEEGNVILNTGCMIRKSVDLWDHEPGFYCIVLEPKHRTFRSIQWVPIPKSPSHMVMTTQHLDEIEDKHEKENVFIGSIRKMRDERKSISFEDNIKLVTKKVRASKSVVQTLERTRPK